MTLQPTDPDNISKHEQEISDSEDLPIQDKLAALDQPLMESPLLLQALFDGELTDEQLPKVKAELGNDPRMLVLSEMRALVKFESEQRLEDYDPNALLNNINRAIAAEKHDSAVTPKVQKNTEKENQPGVWSRIKDFLTQPRFWIPAAVCAAALLLVPTIISHNNNPAEYHSPQEHTIVFMDMDPGSHNNISRTATNAPVIWYTGTQAMQIQQPTTAQLPNTVQLPPSTLTRLTTLTKTPEEQLTIEQLNTAINLLITRIEALENENKQPAKSYKLILNETPNEENNL